MTTIDEALLHSERRAKQFWLVSILWVVIMVAVAGAFAMAILRFNQTEAHIKETEEHLNKTRQAVMERIISIESNIKQQQERVDNLIADLDRKSAAFSRLEKTLTDTIQEQDKLSHALNLQTVDPKNLTSQQQNFIKQQAKETPNEPPNAGKLAVQAFSQYVDGSYDRAIDLYTEALKVDPELGGAYVGRAQVNFKLKRYEQALADQTRAIELKAGPTHELYYMRAKILMKLDRRNEAISDYVEVSKSAITAKDKLSAEGFIALWRKEYENAAQDFRLAADASPPSDKAGMLENIGLIYLGQSDWDRAYKWSVEISKTSVGPSWNPMIQALAAEKLGMTQQRQEAVKNFIQRNSDPKETLSDLEMYLPEDLAQLAAQWVQ